LLAKHTASGRKIKAATLRQAPHVVVAKGEGQLQAGFW
jgi:hypothetical protein